MHKSSSVVRGLNGAGRMILAGTAGLRRALFYVLAAMLALGCGSEASAKKRRSETTPSPPRIEIPIARTVMSSGSVRYWVPVMIGGIGPIRALLDTGSTGLLVLNRALEGKGFPKAGSFVYGFDSNEILSGTINQARVRIGDLTSDGAVRFGVIRKTKCAPKKPKCSIDALKPGDYGIGGDGTAGEGFDAIIGIGLDHILIANPLVAAHAGSWIVTLPQPGTSGNGTIVVNPTTADLEGFRRYKISMESLRLLGAFRAALPGCLATVDGALNVCGQVGLDTGAPKVYAKIATVPPLADSTTPRRYTLRMSEGEGKIEVPVDETLRLRRLVYFDATPKQKTPLINAGVFPYFDYQVFYDFKNNEIGLKKR